MKLFYTPEAVDDLVRLRTFIEDKNPGVAHRIAKAIQRDIQQLKLSPYIGVEVDEASDPQTVRDLILGNYIVRYLVNAIEIFILRVWHHKGNRL
ncbi:hypothetical protein MNBD_GAMMA12-1927 [hydrothermal vent metagenome]|uniref:Death on curing protein, Doc toxin n=1 Tax=hydrothermal vent metagenome TaxID=652676 RepID=A0A3B0Z1H3_9ZZZZ